MTILRPERIVPALKHTLFFHNARRVIARLMAVEEGRLLDNGRLFCKLVDASETPWHQDAAYHPAGYEAASIWLSLSAATNENGCMHFIKGSHLGEVQPHSLQGDSLVASSVDLSRAVCCPLLPGEATAHHCRTLHYAGPNTTNQSRQALAVVCAVRGAD